MKFVKDLYTYRELLKTSVLKEIRGKYKGAWLGVIWSFLNPLFMSLIYALVFGKVIDQNIPNYPTMVVIGVTAWIFFTTGVSQGTFSIVANGGIIKKVYFPREVLPVAYAISNLIVFFITSLITFVFVVVTVGLSPYILYFPLITVIQALLILGITFITSAINVYFRDLEHIIGVALMALFYLTPVAFMLDGKDFGRVIGFVIKANPMKHIITAYRDVLLFQRAPNFVNLGYVLTISLFLIFVGLPIFRKLQKGFAEEF